MSSPLRLSAALLVLFAAYAAAFPALVAAQDPVNPLRPASSQRVSTAKPSKSQVKKRPAAPAAAEPASTSSPIRLTDYTQQTASAEGTVAAVSYGGPVPIELGPGEFIVEDGAQGVPGELLFEGGGSCCDGSGCTQCCLIPCPVLSLDNFEFFTGVHGFMGAKNRGQSGSFGFHGGFNWGGPVPCSGGALGAQLGLNAAFSNFSGAAFTADDRTQLFLTGGLFRRVDWGLQGGLVIDYLADRWYTDTDLAQVRGQASWMFPCSHELGFWFAAGTNRHTSLSRFSGNAASVSETWRATDLYAFFYRHRFAEGNGSTVRLFAGFTGNRDGLIGGDVRLPLNDSWALESGFTYLIPDEAATGALGGGHEVEAWNVAISLVWYPGCRSAYGNDYFRPLFNVANNGSFIVRRQ